MHKNSVAIAITSKRTRRVSEGDGTRSFSHTIRAEIHEYFASKTHKGKKNVFHSVVYHKKRKVLIYHS